MVYVDPSLKQKCYANCQELSGQQVLGHLKLKDVDIEFAPSGAPAPAAPGPYAAPGPSHPLFGAPGVFPDIASVFGAPGAGPAASPLGAVDFNIHRAVDFNVHSDQVDEGLNSTLKELQALSFDEQGASAPPSPAFLSVEIR